MPSILILSDRLQECSLFLGIRDMIDDKLRVFKFDSYKLISFKIKRHDICGGRLKVYIFRNFMSLFIDSMI